MKTGDKKKTPLRHLGDEVSKGADGGQKSPELGGSGSPGGAGGVEERAAAVALAGLERAETARRDGPGAPRKPDRGRKDFLRDFASELGATPGETILATVLGGLQRWLAAGGELGDYLEWRAEQMAWRLDVAPGEAMKMLQKALADAMPYAHQKLPQAVEIEGGEIRFAVVIGDGALVGTAASAGTGVDLRPRDVRLGVSNIDENGAKSDACSLTIEGKANDISEVDGHDG